MAYALLFDRKQRVLVTRLTGAMTEESLTAMRAAARRFVTKEGACRAIVDLSGVERADVSGRFIAAIAESGPIIVREMRVIVAPAPEVFGLSRMYELHQFSTADNTLVVHTLAEAHAALGVRTLELAPVESA
jgi:ABC-type transporter Mla MlaB component